MHATAQSREGETADLKAFVLREVLPVFQASSSPNLAEAEVEDAVDLVFDLLQHRIGDPNLADVGKQILDCLKQRYFNGVRVRIADRFEPFAKFLIQLTRPARYSALVATRRNHFLLSQALKELELAEKPA